MTETRIEGLVSLVDTVFPDAILELTSEEIEEILQIDALRRDGEWVSWPKKNATISEPEMANFISLIREEVKMRFLPNANPRYCSSMFCDHPVRDPTSKTTLLPDVVFTMDHFKEEERPTVEWVDFVVVLELVSSEMLDKGISRCSRYCERMFDCQPCPRFVPAAVIAGSHIVFIIFDRSGLVCSEKISVHDNPQKFLRLIIGFLFVDTEYLGYETAVEVDGKGCDYIRAGDVEYQVRCIYREPGIEGRGTVCYHGVSLMDKSEVVIKDSWVDVCREETEIGILSKLNEREERELCTPDGVRVIPQIVSHEILKTIRPGTIPGQWIEVDATTAIFRGDLVEKDGDELKLAWNSFDETKRKKVEIRRLCRIVMKPFGQKLRTFTSKKVLVRAFGDIIYAVEILRRNGIVHRDISFHNILLYKHEGELRGLLIDYDHAISIKRASSEAIAERTGTLPFMAFDRMKREPQFPHNYFHDLESIFYVICWTCILYRGRGKKNKRRFKTEKVSYLDTVVAGWKGDGRYNDTLHYIGYYKQSTVSNGCISDILADFAPYFNDMKKFVEAYAELIFFNSKHFLNPSTLRKLEEKKIKLDERELEAPSTDEEKKDTKDDYLTLPIHLRPPSVTIDSLMDVVYQTLLSLPEDVALDVGDVV